MWARSCLTFNCTACVHLLSYLCLMYINVSWKHCPVFYVWLFVFWMPAAACSLLYKRFLPWWVFVCVCACACVCVCVCECLIMLSSSIFFIFYWLLAFVFKLYTVYHLLISDTFCLKRSELNDYWTYNDYLGSDIGFLYMFFYVAVYRVTYCILCLAL